MAKFDSRFSKIILILIGVLAAIAIGYQSSAVSLGSKFPINTSILEKSTHVIPILEKVNELESKFMRLLLN